MHPNRLPSLPRLCRSLKSKLEGAERIAVIGIGSELRGDDAAGVLVARNLLARLEKEPLSGPSVNIFIGGTAPENVTGAVRRFGPTHILLIDAADFGGQPGEIELLDPARTQNVSFSTHGLPVSMLADYLSQETGARVFLLGIQPAATHINDPLSKNIETAVENLAGDLAAVLREV